MLKAAHIRCYKANQTPEIQLAHHQLVVIQGNELFVILELARITLVFVSN